MQVFYKLFVSEKEVVNKLPMFLRPKMSEEKLTKFINRTRKLLFFKKFKGFMLNVKK